MIINDCVIFAADVDMVSAGIIGLIAIMVVVFSILAAKTWHWVNTVFLILTLLAAITATTGMTTVFKLRRDAMLDLQTQTARATKAEEDLQQQVSGNLMSPTYDPGSLRYVNEELSRAFSGRGRVWSGGEVKVDNGVPQFKFAAPRDIPAEGSLDEVVLYAFVEQELGDQTYPTRYVGSVRATAESGTQISLEPIALADPDEFAQPTGTWTLFEKMPQDRRGIFKESVVAYTRANADASDDYKQFVANLNDPNADMDISLFRKILMKDFLTPQKVGYAADSPQYEKLIDYYAFDGVSIGKIEKWLEAHSAERKSPRFEPAPEEVFVKFRFDKPSSKPIAVDANGSLENDGLFNLGGLAVVPELKNNKTVEFAIGDEVYVDQLSADGYQRGDNPVPGFSTTETVTEIDRIYVRQVRDFPFEFKDLRINTQRLADEIARVQKTNQVQDVVLADAKKQIAVRTQLIFDNEADQKNLETDLSTITDLGQQKAGQVDNNLQQLASLQEKIDVAYRQLREFTLQISRRAFAKN